MRKSLEHLAELGHQTVALFNFPQDQLDAGYTSALIARDAFEETTAELDIRGIHLPSPHPPSEALEVATELLRSEPDCTAAITTGWQFTGLLGALRAADMHVPDDFSIVSVVASQFAEMLTPALTCVEWPAFEAGRVAAEMLIERLGGGTAPLHQLLVGGELVVRESTGPAPPVLVGAGSPRRRPRSGERVTAGPVVPVERQRLALQPILDGSVEIHGGFWGERQRRNREVTIPYGMKMLEESGTIENFRIAAGNSNADYQLPQFRDSDLYKVLEAIGWERAHGRDPEQERFLASSVELIAAAQEPDGYVNSYIQVVEQGHRFADPAMGHELYCAGHLIQAVGRRHAHARRDRPPRRDRKPLRIDARRRASLGLRSRASRDRDRARRAIPDKRRPPPRSTSPPS